MLGNDVVSGCPLSSMTFLSAEAPHLNFYHSKPIFLYQKLDSNENVLGPDPDFRVVLAGDAAGHEMDYLFAWRDAMSPFDQDPYETDLLAGENNARQVLGLERVTEITPDPNEEGLPELPALPEMPEMPEMPEFPEGSAAGGQEMCIRDRLYPDWNDPNFWTFTPSPMDIYFPKSAAVSYFALFSQAASDGGCNLYTLGETGTEDSAPVSFAENNGLITSKDGTVDVYKRQPLSDLEQALFAVQMLDPPGVGARDLSECLILQLAQGPYFNALTVAIARDGLDLLAAQDYKGLCKKLGAKRSEVDLSLIHI